MGGVGRPARVARRLVAVEGSSQVARETVQASSESSERVAEVEVREGVVGEGRFISTRRGRARSWQTTTRVVLEQKRSTRTESERVHSLLTCSRSRPAPACENS